MTKPNYFKADGITPTPQTLIKIEEWARTRRTQASIAGEIGLPKREFEALLAKNKGRNELRLAWERGRAAVEQELSDAMFHSALGETVETDEEVPVLGEDGKPTGETKKITVRTVHISKMSGSERMFLMKAQFGWKEGESPESKVSNVTLMLPKPRTRAEFFAMMNVEDTKALGKPGGPTEMKTIEQAPAALPAPNGTGGTTR